MLPSPFQFRKETCAEESDRQRQAEAASAVQISSQTSANLKSIAKQQKRYRKARRRIERGRRAGDFAPQIIESIEKSERAWENELRRITQPEDLDAFEE